MTRDTLQRGRTALTQNTNGEVSQQGNDEEDTAEDISAAPENTGRILLSHCCTAKGSERTSVFKTSPSHLL